MEEERIDLQCAITVHVDELDQPPDCPAPLPPSPPVSIQIRWDQFFSEISIDRLISQIYSSVRSSNSDPSSAGEAMELADLHVTVGSAEEHPMLTVDIRPRSDGSDHERNLPLTPVNGQLSKLNLLILVLIYLFGVCITVLIIVLIVLIFFPDVYECIVHTACCLSD